MAARLAAPSLLRLEGEKKVVHGSAPVMWRTMSVSRPFIAGVGGHALNFNCFKYGLNAFSKRSMSLMIVSCKPGQSSSGER